MIHGRFGPGLSLMNLLLFIICADSNVASAQVEENLLGGQNTTKGEYPWFTAIQKLDHTFMCSGSLIGSRHVLTASHCVENFRDTEVEIGYWCRQKGNCGRISDRIGVRELHRHQSHDGLTGGDLVLLVLNRAVNFPVDPGIPYLGPKVHPKQKSLKRGRVLTMVGAGQVGTGGGLSVFVKKLKVRSLARDECKKRLTMPSLLNDTVVCSTAVDIDGSPCGGDSGSALVVGGKGEWKGRDLILAVHSLGPRVCSNLRAGQPLLHFRMEDATDLLQDVVCCGDSPELWCGASGSAGCDLAIAVDCAVSNETVNAGRATSNKCDSVLALPSSALICDDLPSRITLRYSGGGCEESNNRRGDNATCLDLVDVPPTGAPARLFVRGKRSGILYFDGVVENGGVFDLEANGDEVDSIVEVHVSINGFKVQEILFPTSCAGDGLRIFEKYGSMEFVGYTNSKTSGHVLGVVETQYTITIQNSGDTVARDATFTVNDEASYHIHEGGCLRPSGSRVIKLNLFLDNAHPAAHSVSVMVSARSAQTGSTCESSLTFEFTVDERQAAESMPEPTHSPSDSPAQRQICDITLSTLDCVVSNSAVTTGRASSPSCDSVRPVPTAQMVCTSRATYMTLRYNGGGCAQSHNNLGDKSSCSDKEGGPPTNAPAVVIVTSAKSGREYFNGAVAPGGLMELSTDGYEVDSDMFVQVTINGVTVQEVAFHSSCSGDGLSLFGKFGSVEFVGYTNEDTDNHVLGVAAAVYKISIRNSGSEVASDLSLTVNGEPSDLILPGETIDSFTERRVDLDIYIDRARNTTLAVEAMAQSSTSRDPCQSSMTVEISPSGRAAGGTGASGSGSAVDTAAVVCPLNEGGGRDAERPTFFVLQYNGGGCGQDNNSQADKSECSGGVVGDNATILATDTRGSILFNGQVSIGENFTLASVGDHLTTETTVVITSGFVAQVVEIDTSCHVPIFVGDKFGALEMLGGGPGT